MDTELLTPTLKKLNTQHFVYSAQPVLKIILKPKILAPFNSLVGYAAVGENQEYLIQVFLLALQLVLEG